MEKVKLEKELEVLMTKLQENNEKMYNAYGFSLARDYTMVTEKSSIYMWVTEEEFEKYQAELARRQEASSAEDPKE